MNPSDLLEQFVVEAREGLERIGRRLLEVERDPGDTELLNDLFRAVHTLKGNCGLFEFKALERVVHAAEDLLDRVRGGTLAYHPGLADALLQAMDHAVTCVDAIAAEGTLPDALDEPSHALAGALRTLLATTDDATAAATAVPPSGPPAAAAVEPPDWVRRLPEVHRRAHRLLVRYRPEPACFFKGEDPWHLARTLPGLLHLEALPAEPWATGEDFDCYRCNLILLAATEADEATLLAHFRYVAEQVETWRATEPTAPQASAPAPASRGAEASEDAADAEADAVLRARVDQLWQDQLATLAACADVPGGVAAVRGVLDRLRRCVQADVTGPLPEDAPALAAWARRHAPGAAADDTEVSGDPSHVGPSGGGIADTAAPAAGAGGIAPPTGDGRRAPPSDDAGGPKLLKVAQDKIDRLMELIGEMVVAKNALPYLAQRAETVYHQRELAREIKAQQAVISRIAEDMQRAIMQVRMQPVGAVFQRFGRLVRDLSRKLGKQVQLVVEGEDTEADKNVIEALADPLIHILRNSLDHGLETPEVRLAAGKPAVGTLKVAARQEGDRVLLEISDDGAGVDTDRVRRKAVERGLIPADRASTLTDAEAVQLVFLPGFSTAETISDLSGRGVGMDVVRSAVERVNGSVELVSTRGRGTVIRLALPLSMAVTHVMMVEAAGRRFGVPMDTVLETVRVHAEDIHRFKQSRTAVLRGRIVPLLPLHDVLQLETPPRTNDEGEHAVLVVRLGSEPVGLLVDEFLGTSDIILKPLEGVLAGLTAFSGTALMGDGSVLMVLNPKEAIGWASAT